VIFVAAVLIVAIVVTRIVEGVLAEVRADPRLRPAVFDGRPSCGSNARATRSRSTSPTGGDA
jgi:hypothetical protein